MKIPRALRRWAVTATATCVAAAGLIAGQATTAHAAVACDVVYTPNTWTSSPGQGGFTANLTLKNLGDPLTAWTLAFDFPTTTQRYTPSGWGANWSQSGTRVTGHEHALQRRPRHRRRRHRRLQRHLVRHQPEPHLLHRERHHLRRPRRRDTLGRHLRELRRRQRGRHRHLHRPAVVGPHRRRDRQHLAHSGDTDLTVCSGASLTFTPANWHTAQTVTLAAAQDADQVGTPTSPSAGTGVTTPPPSRHRGRQRRGHHPRRHVDNPYAGATGLRQPGVAAKAAAEPGGSRIANSRPPSGWTASPPSPASAGRAWACGTTWTRPCAGRRQRRHAAGHPVRHLQPARPGLLGAGLQR